MHGDIDELTDQDRAILAFERDNPVWQFVGSKEAAIRERFDLPVNRYYQRLNQIINSAAGETAEPATVRRLKAGRDRNARAAARKLAPHPTSPGTTEDPASPEG